MVGQPTFGDCRLAWGKQENPSNTTLGITLNEAENLGKYYWSKALDGTLRVVKICKNLNGASVAIRRLQKYVTTAGRFRLDVTDTTDNNDRVAGAVEESYSGGVAAGYYFRLVVYAEKMGLILQTTANALVTMVVGNEIVASDDNGAVVGIAAAAANAAVLGTCGRSLVATTNTVDNGTVIQCELSLLR